MENEYGDALRLGSNCRHDSIHMWIKRVGMSWQVKLCDHSLARVIPERRRGAYYISCTKRYTNLLRFRNELSQ